MTLCQVFDLQTYMDILFLSEDSLIKVGSMLIKVIPVDCKLWHCISDQQGEASEIFVLHK